MNGVMYLGPKETKFSLFEPKINSWITNCDVIVGISQSESPLLTYNNEVKYQELWF